MINYEAIETAFTEMENIINNQIASLIAIDRYDVVKIFSDSLTMTRNIKNKILDKIIESKGIVTDEIKKMFSDFLLEKKQLYMQLETYGVTVDLEV